MRDYFNGFLILVEDQYELNDLITVGDVTGVVEQLGMRMTVLRDLEGCVHFIPNGQMKQVTNRTHQWSQAVFDIGIAYKENVDQVMSILMELANGLRKDPEYGSYIIGDPVMLGVEDFGDAAVKIKFLIKTKADKMRPVKREMLRRIKNKFDEMGISIPVPHRVVFQQKEGRDAKTNE
jgi:small conductance mechanosensitive channel